MELLLDMEEVGSSSLLEPTIIRKLYGSACLCVLRCRNVHPLRIVVDREEQNRALLLSAGFTRITPTVLIAELVPYRGYCEREQAWLP
jgi:hypothetical protein